MAILFHGTTLFRARSIMAGAPDAVFVEPGGTESAGAFCTCCAFGPFFLGRPEVYACSKARQFPDEDGPAIVIVDVPDEVIALAVDEVWLPLSQGIIDFSHGPGIDALRSVWHGLKKRIIFLGRP